MSTAHSKSLEQQNSDVLTKHPPLPSNSEDIHSSDTLETHDHIDLDRKQLINRAEADKEWAELTEKLLKRLC